MLVSGALLALAAAVVCAEFVDPLPDCPVFPQRLPPATIKDLRPQDVRVIMALGDSITGR